MSRSALYCGYVLRLLIAPAELVSCELAYLLHILNWRLVLQFGCFVWIGVPVVNLYLLHFVPFIRLLLHLLYVWLLQSFFYSSCVYTFFASMRFLCLNTSVASIVSALLLRVWYDLVLGAAVLRTADGSLCASWLNPVVSSGLKTEAGAADFSLRSDMSTGEKTGAACMILDWRY